MTNWAFNTGIPAANDDPSVDQPDMLQNNVSTNGIIAEDHIGFNINNGGYHQQTTMFNQSAPGLKGADGVLFAGLNGGSSWPQWQNALGVVPLAIKVPSLANPGYTSIPGGVIVQWGFINGTHGGAPQKMQNGDFATTTFPIIFPTSVFDVFTTGFYDNTSAVPNGVAGVAINRPGGVIATNQFTWTFFSNSSFYTGFFWWAIGF
jgi:hypothetical protein